MSLKGLAMPVLLVYVVLVHFLLNKQACAMLCQNSISVCKILESCLVSPSFSDLSGFNKIYMTYAIYVLHMSPPSVLCTSSVLQVSCLVGLLVRGNDRDV